MKIGCAIWYKKVSCFSYQINYGYFLIGQICVICSYCLLLSRFYCRSLLCGLFFFGIWKGLCLFFQLLQKIFSVSYWLSQCILNEKKNLITGKQINRTSQSNKWRVLFRGQRRFLNAVHALSSEGLNISLNYPQESTESIWLEYTRSL